MPGWTDNINGPTGLLIGAGKGVIRTMYCNENSYADYLPVDIAVNAFLLVSWNFLYFGDNSKRFFNLTSSNDFKVYDIPSLSIVVVTVFLSLSFPGAVAGRGISKSSFSFLVSPRDLEISWAEIIKRGRRITQRVPLNGVVWYPGGSMKKSRLMHNICVLLFHMIPAYIIDTLIFLAGYKPM